MSFSLFSGFESLLFYLFSNLLKKILNWHLAFNSIPSTDIALKPRPGHFQFLPPSAAVNSGSVLALLIAENQAGVDHELNDLKI